MNQEQFVAKWGPRFQAEVREINWAVVVHDTRPILEEGPVAPIQRIVREELVVDEQTMREVYDDARRLLASSGQKVRHAAELMRHVSIVAHGAPAKRVARAIFGALDRRHYGEDAGIFAAGSTAGSWENEE